jgi:hypothetical protein
MTPSHARQYRRCSGPCLEVLPAMTSGARPVYPGSWRRAPRVLPLMTPGAPAHDPRSSCPCSKARAACSRVTTSCAHDRCGGGLDVVTALDGCYRDLHLSFKNFRSRRLVHVRHLLLREKSPPRGHVSEDALTFSRATLLQKESTARGRCEEESEKPLMERPQCYRGVRRYPSRRWRAPADLYMTLEMSS